MRAVIDGSPHVDEYLESNNTGHCSRDNRVLAGELLGASGAIGPAFWLGRARFDL